MPLAKLQSDILPLLAAHRDPESYVAGSTPLNVDAARYSGDIDIFHDREERVARAAAEDSAVLQAEGYDLRWLRREPAMYAVVAEKGGETTWLEWAVDADFRFFPTTPANVAGTGRPAWTSRPRCSHSTKKSRAHKETCRIGRTVVRSHMKTFWTFLSIDALVFLVLGYFFLAGLGDGTVSSFNIAIWLPLVGVPAAVLWGGLHLKAIGRLGAAKLLLALLAVPGLLLGGWMLLIVVLFATNPGAHH